MRHFYRLGAALAVFALGLSAAAVAFGGSGGGHEHKRASARASESGKIRICHATGSSRHPFVQLELSAEGVWRGHLRHRDQADIVPAFTLVRKHRAAVVFAGQNLSTLFASGQTGAQILASHCLVNSNSTSTGNTTTTTPVTRASLELRKQLQPATDNGRFNLIARLSGGSLLHQTTNVGNGATSGRFSVPVGSTLTVEETAAGTTTLTNYSSKINCKVIHGPDAGTSFTTVNGTATTLTIKAGNAYTCTFTNTRK